MAVIIGNPGMSAAKRGGLMLVVVLGLSAILSIIISALLAYSFAKSALSGILGICFGVVAVWITRKDYAEIAAAIREGQQWIRGAKGEIDISRELSLLPDDFVVFNDLHLLKQGQRADWNIDHVVVGPTGVFVLDAKNGSQKFVASASRGGFTKDHVVQVQRNAMDLKNDMRRWSSGELTDLFVVPIVVHAGQDKHVERLREDAVRVLPQRLVRQNIEAHTERAIDMDRAHKIARVLFTQLSDNDQAAFAEEIRRYGAFTRQAPGSTAPTPAPNTNTVGTTNRRCPKCGLPLIRRVARQGAHAGKAFLGCTGFPKCRYVEGLPDEA